MICTPFTGQPVKGVFFMRYSYEFKVKCVEMYERGKYPDTPDGVTSIVYNILCKQKSQEKLKKKDIEKRDS